MPIKEFREFFLRETQQSTGDKRDQEVGYPIIWRHPTKGNVKNRWLKNHWPTEGVIRKFFESITFKINPEDRAKDDTESDTSLNGNRVQGLVTVATSTQAKNRDNGDTSLFTRVPRTSQLPSVVQGSTTPTTISNPFGTNKSLTNVVDVTEDPAVTTRSNYIVTLATSFKTLIESLLTDISNSVMRLSTYAEPDGSGGYTNKVLIAREADDIRGNHVKGQYYGTGPDTSVKGFYPLPEINADDFNTVDPWSNSTNYEVDDIVSYRTPAMFPVPEGPTKLYRVVTISGQSNPQPPMRLDGSTYVLNTPYWEEVSSQEYIASLAHVQNTDTSLQVPGIGPLTALELHNRVRLANSGRILTVSSVGANDEQAALDHSTTPYASTNRPFATLERARTEASSGDLIVVTPGNYTVTTTDTNGLGKNGVSWYFCQNTTIRKATSGSMFVISNSVVYDILGFGNFIQEGTNAAPVVYLTPSGTLSTVASNNVSSGITVEFKKIFHANGEVAVLIESVGFTPPITIKGEVLQTSGLIALEIAGVLSSINVHVGFIFSPQNLASTTVVRLRGFGAVGSNIDFFNLLTTYARSITITANSRVNASLVGTFGLIHLADSQPPQNNGLVGAVINHTGTCFSFTTSNAIANTTVVNLGTVHQVNIFGGNVNINNFIPTTLGDNTLEGGNVRANLYNTQGDPTMSYGTVNIRGGNHILQCNIHTPLYYRLFTVTGGYTQILGTVRIEGALVFPLTTLPDSLIFQNGGTLDIRARILVTPGSPNRIPVNYNIISQEALGGNPFPVCILNGASLANNISGSALIYKFNEGGFIRTLLAQANKDYRTYQPQIVQYTTSAAWGTGIQMQLIFGNYNGSTNTVQSALYTVSPIPNTGDIVEDYRTTFNLLAAQINADPTANTRCSASVTTAPAAPVLTITGTANAANGDAWVHSVLQNITATYVQQIQRPITTSSGMEEFNSGSLFISSNVQ